ncbi:MAG: hypothetical protein JWP89_3627 [Schlesneria sp.]|nr:hypothetical protein [Schlesneria sp.]
MKSVIRIAATILAPCVPFIVGVFLMLLAGVAEGYVRSLARKPIPVIIQDDLHAVITADVAPDFLWIGQAWRVNVDCDTSVLLEFNSDWTASLPPGRHQIYSDHDNDNTADYGSKAGFRQKPPTVITVRAAEY